MYHVIFIAILLLIGIPCLLAPRNFRNFVINFNEKFGYMESENSFRKSEKYISRLRMFGVLLIGSAILISLIGLWKYELAVYILENFKIENAS